MIAEAVRPDLRQRGIAYLL